MFNMETVSHYNMTETETKSAAELRKQNKPLMEKRRRARINDSLNKLKSLVLDAMKRDTSRYSKLEKADILEMTVKHLRAVQRQQMAAAMASDTTVVSKYRAGFVECASEVTRYLNSIDGLDPQVRNRLMGHLSNCTQKVTSLTAMQEARSHPMMQPMHVQIPSATPMSGLPGTGYTTSSNGHMMAPSSSSPPPPPPSMGGEGRISGAFQMVPGTLHGGQFAVLVPSGDGYALSSAPASHLPPSSAVYTGSAERPPMQSYGSLSSTSPSMTSPMSLTSPTSDRVFRYGSASSDASSSEEEEVEVALDMRVEPCRDVNANIIKPTTSQADHRRMTSSPNTSRDFQVPRPQLVPAGHGQGQGVKAEDMWRPW